MYGSNMLYGGPLGAYLSGVYGSSSASAPAGSSPPARRRGSLRNAATSTGLLVPASSGGNTSSIGSSSSSSSLSVPTGHSGAYYTPQPSRRKYGASPERSSITADAGRYSLHDSGVSLEPSSYRSTRQKGDHDSSYLHRPSTTPTYGRSHTSSYEAPDYKKLYEKELNEASIIRADIEKLEKELSSAKLLTEISKKELSENRTNVLRQKLEEYEQEVMAIKTLKKENRLLSDENDRLNKACRKLGPDNNVQSFLRQR